MPSHGEEIWKWDEAAKKLDLHRTRPRDDHELDRALAECAQWRRMYEAKSIECARMQKRVEELEGKK